MSIALSTRRKASSFRRLPFFVKVWFGPTLILLLLSKIAISVFSFRRLAPLLGDSMGVHPFLPIISATQRSRVVQIAMLVNLASRYLPLEKSCFPLVITARVLLGLYHLPYCIFFGVRRLEDGIDAHAWAFSGARCICGGRKSFWQYRVLAVFATPGLIPERQQSNDEFGHA